MTTTTLLEQSEQHASPNAPGTDAEHTPDQREKYPQPIAGGGFVFSRLVFDGVSSLDNRLTPAQGIRGSSITKPR